MFHSQVEGAITCIANKLKLINKETHVIPVLYCHQVYWVHNAYDTKIILFPFSIIHYRSKTDGKIYDSYQGIISIDEKDKDVEFFSVLDQAVANEPVTFEYVQVPRPRYSDYEEYYMRQIKKGE